MCSISLIRLSLLLACFISVTVGWVPRFENRRGGRPSIFQFAEANRGNHQVPEQLLIIGESLILFDDLIFHPYNQVQDILDSVSERADELAAATFAPFGKQEQCIDYDCDQECLIPEEWIPSSGEMDVTEVMRFLGIRRVT